MPESGRVLSRQHDRWHRGLADVLWRHRVLLFNPRCGAMGLVAYPYFVCVELLAPVIEMLGLVLGLLVGALNGSFAALFFLVAYGLGILLSASSLLLEEFGYHRYGRVSDRLWLLLYAFAESIGYRQATVLWRLRGLWSYLRGRTEWGAMERRGFRTPPTTAAGQ